MLPRLAIIAALAGMAGTAYASWSISYTMTSAARDLYRVYAYEGKVLLCVEVVCHKLTPKEARSLAVILESQADAVEPPLDGGNK